MTARAAARCGVEHFAAAGGVDGQHADAEPGRFVHGCGHGGRNVVILQVEEDAPPRGHEIPHQLRPFGGEELHADFVGQCRIADGRHDFLCGRRRGNVQGNDQFCPWVNCMMTKRSTRDGVGQSRHP